MNLPKVGDVASGTVIRMYPSYAILLFEEGWTGLLHISELSTSYIRCFESFVKLGSIYSVKVIAVEEEEGTVRVSLKRMTPSDKRKSFAHHPIPKEEISFTGLQEHLQGWIENYPR